MVDRRNMLIGGAAAVVVAAAGGAWYMFGRQDETFSAVAGVAMTAPGAEIDMAKLMDPAGDVPDHPVGNADAKVVVIEYLSPSCPHCAAFHTDVYPQIKTEYIDTDKVLFIPRPFVRNVLDSAIFLLAEAAGPDKYHEVIDTYFDSQAAWITGPSAMGSEKGTPSSSRSAPASTRACISGTVTSGCGSPAVI